VFIYIIVFVFGVCIGSFLNVLIYRVPLGLSFIKGFSVCPACGERVMPLDLVPILSYILLRGKCRYCKAAISIRYPVVELLTGVLALAACLFYGYTLAAIAAFGIWCLLAVISFIDLEHTIIPNGMVIALAALSVVFAVFSFNDITLLARIIGFFSVSFPMFFIAMLIRDAFGGGDVKLSAVCGFLLGWQMALLAIFIAILLGGCQGMYIKYIKRAGNKHIAFGPYICLGVFIAFIWGEEILRWYLGLLF
jgi:leader peptidase (prepilin peptidase)/N-methyltransferase